MLYGYGVLNNHVPTLKATAMKGGTASPFLTSLYAVYKAESNANDSLATYNGTAQGGLTYTAGMSGNAFSFNGTTAYVSLPDNSFNFTSDFSVSFWIYPTSGAPQSIIDNFAYSSGTINKGWFIDINNISGATPYKVTFVIAQSPGVYVGWEFTTTSLTANSWNHVLIKRISSVNTYCWINNISQSYTLRGTLPITTNPIYHTTQYTTLGSQKFLNGSVGNYLANGSKIDELNIWNRSLSSTEITDLYNVGTGKFYPTF